MRPRTPESSQEFPAPFSNVCLFWVSVRRDWTVLVFEHPRDWFQARYVGKKFVRYARMSGDLRLFTTSSSLRKSRYLQYRQTSQIALNSWR